MPLIDVMCREEKTTLLKLDVPSHNSYQWESEAHRDSNYVGSCLNVTKGLVECRQSICGRTEHQTTHFDRLLISR